MSFVDLIHPVFRQNSEANHQLISSRNFLIEPVRFQIISLESKLEVKEGVVAKTIGAEEIKVTCYKRQRVPDNLNPLSFMLSHYLPICF